MSDRLKRLLKTSVLSGSGRLSRLLRHRIWRSRPYRRRTLDLARNRGLGDVLMCTPALRTAKALNPDCRIRFYTDFPDLLEALPYIDEVHPFDSRPSDCQHLAYEDVIPTQAHIAEIFGDVLGLKIDSTVPDCAIDDRLRAQFRDRFAVLRRPRIVLLRRAGPWTGNKDWPQDRYDALVERLLGFCSVIEIGEDPAVSKFSGLPDYLDLRGGTDLRQLAAAIAAGDIYLGPDSGPMHLAAAAGKRSVVIFGGYTHPRSTSYPGNISLYSPEPCAPCWLTTPCPRDRACLEAIAPIEVEAAVRRLSAELQLA